MKNKLTMKKEKGHGNREGGGAFVSNTNYMKKKKINNDKRRDMVVGKVVAHLCLALIFELKFSVEHDRVVTTLNLIKH
jgi:hypothetical protein